MVNFLKRGNTARRRGSLAGIPASLWRRVSLARGRLLMLDYDGTLAPFRVARHEARPSARTLRLLRAIAGSAHTSVAIVSGRPLREVERLIGALPAVFVGEHGWERRGRDGRVDRVPLAHSVSATIDEAERAARSLGWGRWLERKRSAVVLHTRAMPEAEARDVRDRCVALWRPLAAPGHVSVDRIDGGMELRARGRNKGLVALSLLSESPPGTLGVFVGDDVTDEDAFDALRDRGFGVRVGGGDRPSLALGHLPSPDAVPDFLEEWVRVTEPPEGARS
ncbi:MAG TPA: trehalose-phosphatase [Candidatus Eisenbacteria bacterium]|jgi:trehalose-phosphatase